MRATTVHRTVRLLESALDSLGATYSERQLESIGIMINRAMLNAQRSFHTPEHIFALIAGKEDDAVIVLAALFHDIVYCQVDQGLDPQIQSLVGPYLSHDGEQYRLSDSPPATSAGFKLACAVFGFKPGDTLKPFSGANEFLSTLAMLLSLESCLETKTLIAAAACIELTIPFRPDDEQGRSPAQCLFGRLATLNRTLPATFSDGELAAVVERATAFANSDVENFAEEEVGRFLDNTWKLLPETNPELRTFGVYTLASYRTAIMKMCRFMDNLDPKAVFGHYGDEPGSERYERLLSLAGRNIATARSYLGYKLLAAVLLEALAKVSGGDAPVAYFVGNTDSAEPDASLADFLPDSGECRDDHSETELFSLLAQGRASDIFFDLSRSPLASYLFCQLDRAAFRSNLDLTWRYCSGDLDAAGYLQALPCRLVTAVAGAVGKVAFTRQREMERLVTELRRTQA